jgi:heme/copper-type cytochrome/quinol oxidase subunit 4
MKKVFQLLFVAQLTIRAILFFVLVSASMFIPSLYSMVYVAEKTPGPLAFFSVILTLIAFIVIYGKITEKADLKKLFRIFIGC